jgi:predicted transcriptional regulator
MKKKRDRKIQIGVCEIEEFFERGRVIARLADAGKEISFERNIWFEERKDLSNFIHKKSTKIQKNNK